MRTETFVITSGRCDRVKRIRCPDTGADETMIISGHGVSFATQYGHEYTHLHLFPDSPLGAAAAARLAGKAQRQVDAHGLAGLNLVHWTVRTIYGSCAYQDEEPALVERERFDDENGL